MELYLIHPENKEYIAGKAQYPASISRPDGCFVLFLPLLLVVFALLLVGYGLNMLRENVLLSSELVTVQGRIIRRYIDEDEYGMTYHVVFEYVANDRRYERRQQVGKSEYRRYERGLIVDIEYSPSDPSVARLAGTNAANDWRYAFIFLCGGLFLLICFFWGGMVSVSENRKRRALLENGKRLQGRLLSHTVVTRTPSMPDGCFVPLLLFLLLFVVMGLLLVGYGLNLARENVLLSSELVTVQGRIIKGYVDEDEDGMTYRVVFEYVANDRRYERQQYVHRSEYGRYKHGLIVDIEYSPSDPSVARLADPNAWLSISILLGLAVLWTLFGGFLLAGALASMVSEKRKRRALLENGKRLQGSPLSLSVDDRGEDTHTVTVVTAAFRTPSGRIIQAERRYTTNRGLTNPPPAEAALAIFYMDDDHWEVL